jgi:BirA family biotin operon repressor/biotin-[acetyl-CoA-carboxylase] ligase
VSELRYFEKIGSTNQEALDWAVQGALDGALVVANAQSAGRGRLQRQWVTRPGAALAFSLVLRLGPEEGQHSQLYSPLGALAVCEALAREYGLRPEIKWPNDVLLAGRKVCGVLAEAGVEGSSVDHVVLGIGVNVTAQAVPPADALRFPAVSVEEGLGSPVNRIMLLAAILRAVFMWRERVGTPGFITALNDHLAYRGRQVHIVQEASKGDEAALTGKVTGFAQDGRLILDTAEGRQFVTAGDVSLRLFEASR